jgi:hypothetical protein
MFESANRRPRRRDVRRRGILLGRPALAVAFAFVTICTLTSASCAPQSRVPGAPVIESTVPDSIIPYTPSNIQVVHLKGENLARPDTTSSSFSSDVTVYFRYSYPSVSDWLAVPNRQISGWAPWELVVELFEVNNTDKPVRIWQTGTVQFRVAVRDHGMSNTVSLNVVNQFPLAPVIDSMDPAQIPFTPSQVQVVSLVGKNMVRPDTTGYTFANDVTVYFRYASPSVTDWVAIPRTQVGGYDPFGSKITVDLFAVYNTDQPARISQTGIVQFQVVLRVYGPSNVISVPVVNLP